MSKGVRLVKGFFARLPNLSFRGPENSSGGRAIGFNKVVVSLFPNDR